MPFKSIFSLLLSDLAIDLGTANHMVMQRARHRCLGTFDRSNQQGYYAS